VGDAARLLAGRAGHYCYVSSRSVYRWPIPPGGDESAPVVEADPTSAASDDYAAAKRGGELAAVEAFGTRALLARAGLILGPYEITGRMPWWLRRIERGGDVLAPGPPDLPLQYIDGPDLAAWLLHAADKGVGGVFNTVSKPGQATMRNLLEAAKAATGSPARLVWIPPDVIARAGIAPWTELPVWVPPDSELIGLHTGDVSAVYAAGLSCRPIEETVADTWAWLRAEGDPPPAPDRPAHGVDPDREREVLAEAPGAGRWSAGRWPAAAGRAYLDHHDESGDGRRAHRPHGGHAGAAGHDRRRAPALARGLPPRHRRRPRRDRARRVPRPAVAGALGPGL